MSLLKTYECQFVFEAIFGYQSNYTLFMVDTIEYSVAYVAIMTGYISKEL